VNILEWMIPMALVMGGLWLLGFLWALHAGQFDDPEGAASRIFQEDDDMDDLSPPAAAATDDKKN